MSRKKEALTLSVPPGTKEKLEAIASRLNIMWGKKPSPSGLLVAIAQQKLEIGYPFYLDKLQVYSLERAIKILIDTGYVGEAETLLKLLSDRGDLDDAMRQSLSQIVRQPSTAWRTQVDEHIKNQQPFHLLYHDSQGQNLTYTARCAEISLEEKRFYLQIWCDETDDIKDTLYPELIHNRCLRFDRIRSIVDTAGSWREEGLDFIEVYLHFYRGMVKAYEPRAKDVSNEVIGDVRQVVRRVTNPFWLIREVLRYGRDCVVVSPDNVREAVKQELLESCRHYNLTLRE